MGFGAPSIVAPPCMSTAALAACSQSKCRQERPRLPPSARCTALRASLRPSLASLALAIHGYASNSRNSTTELWPPNPSAFEIATRMRPL